MTMWDESPYSSLMSEPLRNGVYKSKEFHGRGVKIVNMGELFAHDFLSGQEMKRLELTAKELSKSQILPGDLLHARRSLVLEGAGRCSLVVGTPEPTTFESSLIRVRLDQSRAEPRFYFYYFRSHQGRANLASIASQTAVSGVTGSALGQLVVPAPPLSVQRRVASILSAYDDLIENNTRRIAILEEMVRRIYEEWFVRFRFPGHESVRMVESELGLVPEGWKIAALSDLVDDVRDTVSPDALTPETPYVGLEHIPRRSIALAEWGQAAEVQSTKVRFRERDILFGKIRPYFHKVAVAPMSGVASSDAIVIRPKSNDTYGLALAVVSSDAFVAEATQTSNGTKMPRANWTVLQRYPVPIAPETIRARFEELMAGVVSAIGNHVLRNRNLRTTRDLLLPKLISGELDVSATLEPEVAAA
jgi:type I restriction enzyme S subunit